MERTLLVKLIFKFKFHDHECNLWTRFQTEQNWAWHIPRWSQTHYIIARKDLGFFSLCNVLSITKEEIFRNLSLCIKNLWIYPFNTRWNTRPMLVITGALPEFGVALGYHLRQTLYSGIAPCLWAFKPTTL